MAKRHGDAHASSGHGGQVVLAEYTALAGNFQQATMQILQKLESSTDWKSSWTLISLEPSNGPLSGRKSFEKDLPSCCKAPFQADLRLHLRRICLPLHRRRRALVRMRLG